MDRRTRYTKAAIREALFMQIKTKPLGKVSVTDLCRLAQISRPTFYLHYEDINALLDEIGQDMIASARLGEMMELSIEDEDAIYLAVANLLGVIEKNEDIYRVCVLEREGGSRLAAQIAQAVHGTMILKWEREGMLPGDVDSRYIVKYIQASFDAIVSRWMAKAERREPVELLARLIERFIVCGLSGFVRLPERRRMGERALTGARRGRIMDGDR